MILLNSFSVPPSLVTTAILITTFFCALFFNLDKNRTELFFLSTYESRVFSENNLRKDEERE